jgi:hypothetical protein
MKRIALGLAIAGLAGAAIAQTIAGPSSTSSTSPGSADVTSPSTTSSSGADAGVMLVGGDGGTSGDGGTAAAANQVPGQPPMGPYSFEPPRIGLYSFTPR